MSSSQPEQFLIDQGYQWWTGKNEGNAMFLSVLGKYPYFGLTKHFT